MKDRAYAKINLSLDVFNIREDGYHDIASIMLPISFFDLLEISLAKKDDFDCNRSFIRFNESNSIIKMIKAVQSKYDLHDHYRIRLNKSVPLQAGLGGGTADAAAALRILQQLHHLQLSKEEIIDLCLKVGADVPFNYFNVPAIVEGIGDKITPISVKDHYYVLLVKPYSGVSTKEAYSLLDMEKCAHPDIPRLAQALQQGEDLSGLLGNSLEQSALMLNSEIKELKEELGTYDTNVLMSGSGSTVFCIDKDEQKIRKIYEDFKDRKYFIRFAETLNK